MFAKLKKKGKMSLSARMMFLIGAAILALSLYFPWWSMQLYAPQYPEGLDIVVYPSRLDGELEIINSLNHYIGMQEITEESFPELKYIPYILWGFVALSALTGLTGYRRLGSTVIVLMILFGIAGAYDMFRWLHTFGTNLDPTAPIKVDPFVPPVVGQNQLANFITYTGFNLGFYLVILGVSLEALGIWSGQKWATKH